MILLPIGSSVGLLSNNVILSHCLALYLTTMQPIILPDTAIISTNNNIINIASLNTSSNDNVPILEVIKVYGRLAGPTCYGKIAPTGSSCQITNEELKQKLGLSSTQDPTERLTRDEFREQVSKLPFLWPLKPYGIKKSNDKTAIMNKCAETRLYMYELEAKGLYDPRNPTGPLPTSLRSELNKLIQTEKLDEAAISLVFDAIHDNKIDKISYENIDKIFKSEGVDYYEFLDLIGPQQITWD